MIVQVAEAGEPCERCGAPGEGGVAQFAEDGELRWRDEWECTACHVTSCERGSGSPPWIRDAILARHGSYRLTLGDRDAAGVAKVLRDVLRLTVPEVRDALRALRGAGYEGTCVELALVAGLAGLEPPVSTRGR
ncbi:hypothetical protein V1227_37900 [Lentzea sp. DG1S-22]|uniref:hypothetical protein n=1 Tax=Lentzea sp. DG1S-22 TaxID=3108822 RepID=UPI002E79256E|nr:hypothetical protein [Lentzea sp. DG1S-22]WVH80697.1 hypothetical protein V1227_37900 [Lentzea sp. DG1S-22]